MSFCPPPSSVPRWRRWQEGMISRWSLYCIFLSYGAPQKLVLSPTLSFMPWGHCYCYFFCHMVISFAMSLLLLLWGFSLLSWVFSFSREVFLFCRESFLLAVGVFFFSRESFPFVMRFFSFAVSLSLFSVLLFLFVVKFFLLPWVFSFAVSLFLLPRGYFFCRYSCGPP